MFDSSSFLLSSFRLPRHNETEMKRTTMVTRTKHRKLRISVHHPFPSLFVLSSLSLSLSYSLCFSLSLLDFPMQANLLSFNNKWESRLIPVKRSLEIIAHISILCRIMYLVEDWRAYETELNVNRAIKLGYTSCRWFYI